MPLSPIALFQDPDDVWEALCVQNEGDRLVNSATMERWINMASAFMEALLNRPVAPRDFHDFIDGNDRPMIYVPETPSLSLLYLHVWDNDFAGGDQVDVQTTNDSLKEVDFQTNKGRIVLLPNAPISRFRRGASNVEIRYRAGFEDHDLAVIQEAAIELIAIRYNELGRHPLEQNRSDSINTLSTFGKADFDELPFMMKQTVSLYRRRQV